MEINRDGITVWSRVYAGLLAASRNDEAAEVAERLLEDEDTAAARRALVEAALDAGEPRRSHLDWLDEAEAIGGESMRDLRARLEAALSRR